MRIISYGKSDIGMRRKKNEDALVVRPDLPLFAVADGVGGGAVGEIASGIFTETAEEIFGSRFPRSEQDTDELIQEVYRIGNERILSHVECNPHHKGMASTAVLIAFSGERYSIGHVGDSRVYLFREGRLRQITRDHSLVQDQIDKGLITPEQGRTHRLRHVVLRALGAAESVALDLITGTVLPGDLFLLCSDGLSGMVEDAAIEAALSRCDNLVDTVDGLIAAANCAGGSDNITVVLCQVLP